MKEIKNKANEGHEVSLAALQCLEASTVIPPNLECSDNFVPHFEKCGEVFLSFLCIGKGSTDSLLEAKVSVYLC